MACPVPCGIWKAWLHCGPALPAPAASPGRPSSPTRGCRPHWPPCWPNAILSEMARAGSLPELTGAGVLELQRLLASRAVSAMDVCLAFVERIERLNPALNALVRFEAEAALSQARQADARRARGETH